MNPAIPLLLSLALGRVDEPGPADLVNLLVSADRVEREEAARTLDELGPDALPPLIAALKAEDPVLQNRARTLLARIERRSLVEPTRVPLDFNGRPLAEVVRVLNYRTGFNLALDPDRADLAGREIRLDTPGPLPFWEALDAIGRAGHVRHFPGAQAPMGLRAPQILLVDGEPPASTRYWGPIRLHLLSAHRHDDLNLGGTRNPPPTSQRTAYVEMQAFAEPGRFLDTDGIPSIEGIDHDGRPLPAPYVGDNGSNSNPHLQQVTSGQLAQLQWTLPLGLPEHPGRPLRRIRGTLPVILSARRPDPLVIPLAESQGKSFEIGETTLKINPEPANSPGSGSLVLAIQAGPAPALAEASLGLAPDPGARGLPEVPIHQIEFDDDQGRPVSWFPSSVGPTADGGTFIHFHFSGEAPPTRLRYYELNRLSLAIPYDFPDVPLP